MSFKEHGEYDLKVIDNILYLKAKGPFNIEIAQRYAKDLLHTLNTYEPKAQISELTLSIFSPEIQNLVTAVFKQSAKNSIRAEAYIIHDTENDKRFMLSQLKSMRKEIDIPVDFFDNKKDALSWIYSLNL
jgi:hypothetical protein